MASPPTRATEHHIDPTTLREVLHHPDELVASLNGQLAEPEPADQVDYRRHLSSIGTAARVVGRLDVAERYLTRAVELAERQGTDRDLVLARVRLAYVLQWQGRVAMATSMFDRCVAGIDAAGDAGHFVYQHAGKCAYEARDYSRAVDLFIQALA